MTDRLSFERHGSVIVVKLGVHYPSIEFDELSRLSSSFESLTTFGKPHCLLLDFGATNSFGAGFLSALVDCHVRIKSQGGCLALCNLRSFPNRILQATQLNTLWPVHDSLVAGLAAMEETIQAAAYYEEKRAC